jgi:RNA recognition motif-containing protein
MSVSIQIEPLMSLREVLILNGCKYSATDTKYSSPPIYRNKSVPVQFNDENVRVFLQSDSSIPIDVVINNQHHIQQLHSYSEQPIKTLIVHNLPRDITIEMLRMVFEKYGPIRDIYIPKNLDMSSFYYGTNKGFAVIKFLNAEDSAKAFNGEYGRLVIGNKIVSVEFAKEDR